MDYLVKSFAVNGCPVKSHKKVWNPTLLQDNLIGNVFFGVLLGKGNPNSYLTNSAKIFLLKPWSLIKEGRIPVLLTMEFLILTT